MTRMNESEPAPAAPDDSDRGNRKPSPPSNGNPSPPKKPPLYRRPVPMIVLSLLVVGGAIAGVLYWLHARQYEDTDDAFIDGDIVAVSPKVSGIVSRVYINDNSRVKTGDLLVELDDRDYQAQLIQAQGNYLAAQGKLSEAQAQIPVAKANVSEAEAELLVNQANAQNAQDDLNRYLALDVRARSKQQMDNATFAQRSAAAQVENAKAKLEAAKAQLADAEVSVESARGNLKAAQGSLDEARNNVGYCKIRAQCDGVITRKNIEPGMYMQVDQPMFSIVEYDVWIIANFKETQLALMTAGQPVTAAVDAYPGRTLTGKVQSIQNGTGSRFSLLPPENATGNYVKIVQRVPVKIILDPGQNDDPQHLLSPGMSVDPSVKVR